MNMHHLDLAEQRRSHRQDSIILVDHDLERLLQRGRSLGTVETFPLCQLHA
jgi:hypothetical protein